MNKITFTLTEFVQNKLTEALHKFQHFEIGGILIGRKIEQDSFEIVDASISDDSKRFSFASFERSIGTSDQLLKQHFSESTGYYIGEWHSHPSFSLEPSRADIETMIKILRDPDYGVSFLVLLIVHLSKGKMKHSGFFFHRELDEIIPLE